MIWDMLEYYKMVKEKGLNIIYSGPIWADGVEGLSQTLRKRMEFDALSLPTSQAIFSVFIEQMNNMLMYSADQDIFQQHDGTECSVASGVFILGSKNKQYFLQSGNMIEAEQVPAMKERLDFLNTLDKTELRKFYKEQIKLENTNSESKGAGLGLIEIARRANSKIEYSFEPMDNGKSFFTMFITIG